MGNGRMEIKSGIWLRFQQGQLAQLKGVLCWQGGTGRWNNFIDMETEVQQSLVSCLGQVHGLFFPKIHRCIGDLMKFTPFKKEPPESLGRRWISFLLRATKSI